MSHHTLVSFRSARSELAAACSTVGSFRLCCPRLLLSPGDSGEVALKKKKEDNDDNEGHGSFRIMRQKEAVENSSTPVCSTPQASFVVSTAYAGLMKLTVGFGNFENESFERPRKVELFHDGKTFNSEKY